jgi:hypothetical protein
MKLHGTTILAFALLSKGVLGAQVPPADAIPNWSVPATWSPSADHAGIQTMTDVTFPRLFVGVAPCRIADTRTGQGFSAQAGPPILLANTTRNFQISGSPGTLPPPPNGCAGGTIPAQADAVSLQFTIVSPSDGGNLIAWPAGSAQPQVSVLNWSAGTVALRNGTIGTLSGAGPLSVRLNIAAGAAAQLIIDVNGYFSEHLQSPNEYLELYNSSTYVIAAFGNTSTTCVGVCGLVATVAGGSAIHGVSDGTGDQVTGVTGRVSSFTGNSAGVLGSLGTPFATNLCCGPVGVRGQSPHVGVVGLGGDIGVAGRTYDANGNATGVGDVGVRVNDVVAYGIQGTSLTSANGSAGVRGVDHSGEPSAPGFTCCNIAGVRGSSFSNTGVDGVSRDGVGVTGFNKNALGQNVTYGALGVTDEIGIQYSGGLVGTMSASVVEPHPTDAGKAVRYTSLEGNESGTYFRGRGKFERGLARIPVPEDFRIITDPEGLTVQITPIGEMASYAVVRAGLDEIVVKGSRNVEFYYAVNGVRQAYRDLQPIVPSRDYFMPASAAARLPAYFGPEDRKRLIANGTYMPDGTVNVDTAERLGWTRIWEERKKGEEAAGERARETALREPSARQLIGE